MHDETGLLPSAYRPADPNLSKAEHDHWHVRTFGNFTLLERAYSCLAISERWAASGSRSPGRAPATMLRMRDELRDAFQGGELPFMFGYGCQRSGVSSNGVMLAAWRASVG